ncbi:hypothetical protein BAUCODRAFT_31470 [Baudoinia panamericana UAMH 10762]|uniref:Uncharacterized protein n=1 Tax=Baudoinia panamericana (strain UAMH 10762) TaxID=717646 RepID=M2N561_BAUPA|nr:uncharacterized protein BAUCODRAFT_31470 [Baudoinia panamericana UAMH 10762]EMC99153.1 hypothetical protein BAUCODRAFT_31470 [Baudoinia panamericana UAMH 10762]
MRRSLTQDVEYLVGSFLKPLLDNDAQANSIIMSGLLSLFEMSINLGIQVLEDDTIEHISKCEFDPLYLVMVCSRML